MDNETLIAIARKSGNLMFVGGIVLAVVGVLTGFTSSGDDKWWSVLVVVGWGGKVTLIGLVLGLLAIIAEAMEKVARSLP